MKTQDSIPSVEKSIRVLQAIAGHASNFSIAELAKSLGIPQTTVYRIVRTYMAADWIRPRASGVGYSLSFGLMPLLEPFMNRRILIDLVRQPMTELSERARMGVKLSVREGTSALTVYRLEPPESMGISVRVGSKFPLVYGSSGAALLCGLSPAEIEEVIAQAPAGSWKHQKPADVHRRIAECRETGVCRDCGHYMPHIHTLSAAIKDREGKSIAAVTLLGMPGDFDGASIRNHKKNLLAMVGESERLLESQPEQKMKDTQ